MNKRRALFRGVAEAAKGLVNRRTRQELTELCVFEEFVRCSGLPISSETIRQLPPPSPDVVCDISGDLYGFELTLITDDHIEKKVRGRVEGSQYSNFKITIEDVATVINKKNKKTYSVSPVDLVIHEGETPIGDLWHYDQTELDRCIQHETNCSSFSRVWLFDRTNEFVRVYTSAG